MKETTKTSKSKKTTAQDKIIEEYIAFKLTQGNWPPSIYQFTQQIGMEESEFYENFNSFEDLESYIWDSMITSTIKVLEKDKEYAAYSIREKLLAFFYTWLEVLKGRRSYILAEKPFEQRGVKEPAVFSRMKDSFRNFMKELVVEGKDTGEIANRPILSDQYDKLFWAQLLFLLRFWIKDTSRKFEKTDAAVEKSVNLGLDLVAKGPVDSMIDFAKFLFENRR